MNRRLGFQYILITSLVITAGTSLGAQSLSQLLDAEAIAKLRISGGMTSTGTGADSRLSLKPRDKNLDNLQSIIETRHPDILVEALYLCPVPPGYLNSAKQAEASTAVYNILRSIGSLQGIEYYSTSRKRRAVLFEESWRIADAQSRQKLPDEKLTSIPARETLWAWQKDASLGSAVYRVDFSSGENRFSGVFSNQTDIKFGPVVLAKKQAMEVHLHAFMCEEGILLYLVAQANIAVVPGLAGKFKASLENRLEALHSWFSASVASDGRVRK